MLGQRKMEELSHACKCQRSAKAAEESKVLRLVSKKMEQSRGSILAGEDQ